MFPEALDEVVGPGQGPGGEQMGPRPVGLLQAHVVHHRHQVQVDGGDGVALSAHPQHTFHDPGAGAVVPLEIAVVGLEIQGKGTQARGKQGEEALDFRQPLRQGQVEQHHPRRRHKGRCRTELGRLLSSGGQGGVQLAEGEPGPADLPDGQVGIGVDQAGGQPRGHVGAGEVGLGLPGRLLRVAAEIVVLRQCDVPLGPLVHGCRRSQTLARPKGCVHQRHQVGVIQQAAYGGQFRLAGRGLFSSPAGVLRLLRIGRDGPGPPEFLCAGDAALGAVLVDPPLRHAPPLRRLPEGEIPFHFTAAFPKRSAQIIYEVR